jgi:hypothetical protein
MWIIYIYIHTHTYIYIKQKNLVPAGFNPRSEMLYQLCHPGPQLKLLHLLMIFPGYEIFFSNVNAKTSSQCKVTTWYSKKESDFEI